MRVVLAALIRHRFPRSSCPQGGKRSADRCDCGYSRSWAGGYGRYIKRAGPEVSVVGAAAIMKLPIHFLPVLELVQDDPFAPHLIHEPKGRNPEAPKAFQFMAQGLSDLRIDENPMDHLFDPPLNKAVPDFGGVPAKFLGALDNHRLFPKVADLAEAADPSCLQVFAGPSNPFHQFPVGQDLLRLQDGLHQVLRLGNQPNLFAGEERAGGHSFQCLPRSHIKVVRTHG